MAAYQFVSDSQLMFTAMRLDGSQILINFTERDSHGKSSFVTTDQRVAQAIMGHSFFRKGRITLLNDGSAQEKKEEQKQTVTFTEQAEAEEPKQEEEVRQTAEESVEVQENTEDDTNLVFPNITIAKDYLHRRFGVKKEDIRSLTKITAFAESKGLTITINKEEA